MYPLADERQVPRENPIDSARGAPGAVVLRELVRKSNVCPDQIVRGSAIDAYDGATKFAAARSVTGRALYESVYSLLALQRPVPRCVHLAEQRRELQRVAPVERHYVESRHLGSLARSTRETWDLGAPWAQSPSASRDDRIDRV